MKKALLIIGMIVIFFAGCKKDDILEASKVEMKDVTMERGWEHVKMSGEYSYPQALEGMKIIVSSNENMSESVEYVCALEGRKFDVTIDNLEAGVTYYYRYEYDNGYDKARGDKANFVTVGKPIVVTNNIVNVTKNSAVLSGSVTNNDVENKINVRGFCWSKNTNPTISGSHNNNGSSSGTGTSSFTYNLSYLESNTKYYVRTYARTDWGVVYGEVKSFVTKGEEPEVPNENGYEYVDLGLPSDLKWAAYNVGATKPEGYGNYYAWGEIKTKTSYSSSNSLNYGKQMNDISGNSKYDVATANWGGNWRMPTKAELEELKNNCTWTYTIQNGAYGFKIKSKTNSNSIFLPVGGPIVDGCDVVTYWSSTPYEYGNLEAFYLTSVNHNPDIYSHYRYIGRPVRPVFGGNFTGPEEQPEDEPEEPEIVLPTVTTNSVTNITSNSATCGGNVTSDGNGTVTARGICWSETSEPKINNLYSEESNNGTGTGSFTSSMTNLKANTTYYVRAYATNEAGTVYGEVKSFKTLEEDPETPSANQSFTVKGVTFTMIAVEGGTFKMGAQSSDTGGDNYDSEALDSESPVHSVTLSSYYIGETEVTQELWEAVMGSNPSNFSGPQKPVENVSWNDCQEFITKLNEITGENFRLPTEAEWEYAARGGNKSQGCKYSGSNTIGNVAWCDDNSSSTNDVKTKQANELGIYDMSGNVWEWCQDWYGSYSSGSQTDPTGPTSGSPRVLRGGSWDNLAGDCRVSIRNYRNPVNRDDYSGFRLILQELQ